MQFMLLCCSDERWAQLPQQRRDAVMSDYAAWVEQQIAAGHYVTGGKLDESHTATTVRAPDGRATRITDGPFAETREHIGGFHVIECADRDAAIAIAQTIPTLPVGGTVEVRPMLHLLG